MSNQRRTANAEAKSRDTTSGYENNQSEHYVPNSAIQYTRGGQNVSGGGNYTERRAFSYSVYDDQSRGTEHKWLTDRAARDARELGPNPTLEQHLQKAKKRARDGLLEKLQREEGGTKRDRIKDTPKKRTQAQRKALAEAASECLDLQARQHFEAQEVKTSTVCRKGLNADGQQTTRTDSDGDIVH